MTTHQIRSMRGSVRMIFRTTIVLILAVFVASVWLQRDHPQVSPDTTEQDQIRLLSASADEIPSGEWWYYQDGSNHVAQLESIDSLRFEISEPRSAQRFRSGPAILRVIDGPVSRSITLQAFALFRCSADDCALRIVGPDGVVRRVQGKQTLGRNHQGSFGVILPFQEISKILATERRLHIYAEFVDYGTRSIEFHIAGLKPLSERQLK